MEPNQILTKADLIAFENRLQTKLQEALSQIKLQTPSSSLEPLLNRKQAINYFNISGSTFDEILNVGC